MPDTALLSPLEKKARLHQRMKWRRLSWSVVTIVMLLHVGVAIVAGIWIVARQLGKPEATFERRKEVRLPAEEREHRMNMEAFGALASKPSFTDKLQALQPGPILLPELPKIPVDQVMPPEPSEVLSRQVSPVALAAAAGAGAGQTGAGEDGSGSGTSFFGIEDMARNVVIVVDTSDTMFVRSLEGKKHRFQFSEIKNEAVKLINGLNPNSRFNVVIYEGGAMACSVASVSATDENKASAAAWIQGLSENPKVSINTRVTQGPKLMEGGGTRLDTGFRQAFQMRPDVVYLITDGQVTSPTGAIDPRVIDRELRETLRDLQAGLETPARIHVIYYVTAVARAEEERRLRAIAASNHGQFIQVKGTEKSSATP